jgi:hypothetical protein
VTHRSPLASCSILTLGVIVASLLVGGCASKFPEADRDLRGATGEFEVGAKAMVEKIRTVLTTPPDDIGVAEVDRGSILSGFERHPGQWRIGRRWQEQTRYRITVIPDWDTPEKRCMVEVREMTEQRAAEGMRWESAPEIVRPERSQAMLERIRQQVQQSQ